MIADKLEAEADAILKKVNEMPKILLAGFGNFEPVQYLPSDSQTVDGIFFHAKNVERLQRPNAFGLWVRTCAWKLDGRCYIAYMNADNFDYDPVAGLKAMREALTYALRGNFSFYSTHGSIP